jgi:hypothetical protein
MYESAIFENSSDPWIDDLGFWKGRLGTRKRRQTDTNWLKSASSLHLVCKSIHEEVRKYLYHSKSFWFNGAKSVLSFSHFIPFENKLWISDIALFWELYGHSRDPKHEINRIRNVTGLGRTVECIIENMPNLQRLSVSVLVDRLDRELDDWSFRNPFFAAILRFRQLKKLEVIGIKILYYCRPNLERQYKDFGTALERYIMGCCERCSIEPFRNWCKKVPFWASTMNGGRGPDFRWVDEGENRSTCLRCCKKVTLSNMIGGIEVLNQGKEDISVHIT